MVKKETPVVTKVPQTVYLSYAYLIYKKNTGLHDTFPRGSKNLDTLVLHRE